jgi:pantoate--beta-alanine ligase
VTALVSTRAALRQALRAGPGASGEVAAVLTMGALHAGHVALIREARERVGAPGTVVLTVFVNPLQFGAGEDLDRYPRTLDADRAIAAECGVDLVFAPSADDMYPAGRPQVTVDPGPLGAELEGAARPGHFAGVLTVVCKLLSLVRPTVTCFGEKDYQQLVLVRRMCADLELGVDVVGVPVVREPDGLALSSRNRYLAPDHRATATALSRALRAGATAGSDGAAAVVAAARAELAAAGSSLAADYLELRGVDLEPAPEAGPARLLVAARVGATRLIDNVPVQLGALPGTERVAGPGGQGRAPALRSSG